MPVRITTYAEAFDMLNIRINDRIKNILAKLGSEGRSEKSICYALWKSQKKITQYRGDTRFYAVLENEIKKWSWGKDDPRWVEYNKRKTELEKAEDLRKEEEQRINERQKIKEKYPGYIYFIQGESGGAVKIGYTKDVASRLKTLQTGFPDTLMLLCVVPGKPQNEKELHEKYKKYSLRGEWFKPVPEIMEFIDKYKIKILPIDKKQVPGYAR